MEYEAQWNGITRGDIVSVSGQTAGFVHAATLDGVVQYVMVVMNGKWLQVSAETVSAVEQKRRKK